MVKDPDDLVIEVPGREKTVAELDESIGLGIAGNLFEWAKLCYDDSMVVTFQRCKDNFKDECIKGEMESVIEETTKGLRDSIPYVMDQRDKIEGMCWDIVDKERIIEIGEGSRSGMMAKALQMRGGHARFTEPFKEIIHIDSESEPWVRMMVESLPEDYLKNNVRGITISESLRTYSKPLTKWLLRQGVPTYILTNNAKDDLVKKNPDSSIIIPSQNVYKLGKYDYEVSSFHTVLLPFLDSVASFAIIENKSGGVSKRHKID